MDLKKELHHFFVIFVFSDYFEDCPIQIQVDDDYDSPTTEHYDSRE
jgi:hypothetical protein